LRCWCLSFPFMKGEKATGINTAFGSIFLILGPLIGGYLTENFSWRWIFWINVHWGLIGLLMVLRYIPKSTKEIVKIDFRSFSIYCQHDSICHSLDAGAWMGWLSFEILFHLPFLLCLPSLCLERKDSQVPTLTSRSLKIGSSKRLMSQYFPHSSSDGDYILAIYFQEILGWSPINAGFVIFLCCVPVVSLPPCGWLLDRFGPTIPLSCGYSLSLPPYFGLPSLSTPHLPSFYQVFWPLVIGISLILTPSYATAMQCHSQS